MNSTFYLLIANADYANNIKSVSLVFEFVFELLLQPSFTTYDSARNG
ncbi:hypothetical protein H6F51_11080 [Cyanobacteria bacterium FACHB-DQ100]|nr:hypothetical protein [Cyanobacteria bacterium FACHB-DQ100]